jgi:hypothetical protein
MLAPVGVLLGLTVIPAVAQATTVSHRPLARGESLIHVLDAAGVKDRLEARGTGTSSVAVRSINGTAIAAGIGCTQSSPTKRLSQYLCWEGLWWGPSNLVGVT